MINGKTNLLAWFKMQDKPYFSISRKGKEESGNVAFTNKDRANEDMTSAAAYLDQCLSLLSTGDFFIYCTPGEKGSGKGRSETHFSVSMNEATPHATPAVSGTGGVYDFDTMMAKSKEMAKEEFQKLLAIQKAEALEKEVTELKKENKELNNKIQQPWHKIIDQVHPYVGSIAEQLGLKKTGPALQGAISGVQHDDKLQENSNMTEEQLQHMNKAVHSFCEALQHYSPNEWVSIIERLTVAIQTQPAKIDLALKLL